VTTPFANWPENSFASRRGAGTSSTSVIASSSPSPRCRTRPGEGLGTLDLWVVDGYLHSVDYMTYGDHEALPDLEDDSLDFVTSSPV
jgi:hypothetical protein